MFGIRMMCPSVATCLLMDCCFCEVALYKSSSVGLVQSGYHYFVICNLFSPCMEIWVGTKNVVFCRGYSINVPTLTKYTKRFLTCHSLSMLHNMVPSQRSLHITSPNNPHREKGSSYWTHGDAVWYWVMGNFYKYP